MQIFHVIKNAQTGEINQVPLTQEELDAIEAAKPTLEQRNAAIKAQRAERYKNEAEIYTQRLLLGEVTQEFVQAIRDKIKSELPYEVE